MGNRIAKEVERARLRAEKIRAAGLTQGHSQALPPQPKAEPKRNYLSRRGWKQL